MAGEPGILKPFAVVALSSGPERVAKRCVLFCDACFLIDGTGDIAESLADSPTDLFV
jgi:hypothetical protein